MTTPDGKRFTIRIVDWPIDKEKLANITANNPKIAGEYTEGPPAQKQGRRLMTWPTSYLVFDFETTGLSTESDRVVQICVCGVIDGEVKECRGWIVNPGIPIPEGAARIHGITTERARAEGIAPRDGLAKLLDVMRVAPVVMGHNIHRYDIPILQAECRRHGLTAPRFDTAIDTAAIYKGWKMRERRNAGESNAAYAERVLSVRVFGLKYNVTACIEDLRIACDTAKLHDATRDTHATHLIYEALRWRLAA